MKKIINTKEHSQAFERLTSYIQQREIWVHNLRIAKRSISSYWLTLEGNFIVNITATKPPLYSWQESKRIPFLKGDHLDMTKLKLYFKSFKENVTDVSYNDYKELLKDFELEHIAGYKRQIKRARIDLYNDNF